MPPKKAEVASISDKEARQHELRVVNPEKQAGLFIEQDEVDMPDVIAVVKGLRQIIKEDKNSNNIAIEEARRIISSLPTTITFDEIIQYQVQDDERLGRPSNFGLKEAIQRAEQVQQVLSSSAKIKCTVIYPKVTGSTDPIVQKLARIIKNGRPGMPTVVLLEGPTGVGKTAKLRAACELASVEENDILYFSLPTLAPEDFVGIPYPQEDKDGRKTGYFEYLVLHGIGRARVMLLDETNRAHPKVLNGVMQLMLEGRINDQEFPRLETIFCAINPPEDGNYVGVEEMDDAIRERIDHFIEVKGEPDADIIMKNLVKKLRPGTTEEEANIYERRAEEVCAIAVEWWNTDLNADNRKKCNPRRLEKICRAFLDGEGIESTVDRKVGLNLSLLSKKLQRISLLDMYTLIHETSQVEKDMSHPGPQSADLQIRFVSLINVMHRNGMYKEFCKVAHLYKYVQRDQIPAPDRNKSLYHFVQKAVHKYSDEKTVQEYLEMLKARKEGRAHQEDSLKAVREKLFAGLSDKETVAI